MTDDENVLVHLRKNYEKDEMVSYVVRRMRELKVELGQANSEIDHLNDQLKKVQWGKRLNDELSKEARKEIKKEEIYDHYRTEIIALREKLKRLSDDNRNLIQRLVSK